MTLHPDDTQIYPLFMQNMGNWKWRIDLDCLVIIFYNVISDKLIKLKIYNLADISLASWWECGDKTCNRLWIIDFILFKNSTNGTVAATIDINGMRNTHCLIPTDKCKGTLTHILWRVNCPNGSYLQTSN